MRSKRALQVNISVVDSPSRKCHSEYASKHIAHSHSSQSEYSRALEAVKFLRPLEADKQTFNAGKDEQRQGRCECHHRQGNPNWFGFEQRINHAEHWKDDRNHDHQGKVSGPIVDARVVKFLPTAVALVFNLEIPGEDFSLTAGWARKPETSENCFSRIAFFVYLHGFIRFARFCLDLAAFI